MSVSRDLAEPSGQFPTCDNHPRNGARLGNVPCLPRPALLAAIGGLLLLPVARAALPPVPPVPTTPDPAAATADGRQLLRACLEAHGGPAAYARLRDVNVRLDGKWAFLAPKLQPKLADVRYRGGSEERYLREGHNFVVGQIHTGPAGKKQVCRTPGKIQVGYPGSFLNPHDDPPRVGSTPENDTERRAAAALVADAYTMFLFGPDFFVQRSAPVTRLTATAEVDGRPCDEVLAVLRPGFGEAKEDRVVLFIDQRDRTLRRVQFTLNGLASTQGADVHVDLLDHRALAGVRFPTRFYEQIDHPAPIPAHRWRLTGFDVNRGYPATDLAGPGFTGKAAAPARPLP